MIIYYSILFRGLGMGDLCFGDLGPALAGFGLWDLGEGVEGRFRGLELRV